MNDVNFHTICSLQCVYQHHSIGKSMTCTFLRVLCQYKSMTGWDIVDITEIIQKLHNFIGMYLR